MTFATRTRFTFNLYVYNNNKKLVDSHPNTDTIVFKFRMLCAKTLQYNNHEPSQEMNAHKKTGLGVCNT